MLIDNAAGYAAFMLKSAGLILIVLIVSIGGGAASAFYALRDNARSGAVTVGEWTTYPDQGSPNADPYLRARLARHGLLSLGRGEGLAFTAQRDRDGDVLRRECRYRLAGAYPIARFWTLHAAEQSGLPLVDANGTAPSLNSRGLLREADNSVFVAIGPQPAAGNWLAVDGTGPMELVLTFYDTGLGTTASLTGIALPEVVPEGCDA